MARLLASLVLVHVALFALVTNEAHATAFEVSPMSLTLSARLTSGTIKVTNRDSESARFQVIAYAWTETASGEMKLEPTRDIVFFPAMLSVGPKESRQLRVGVNGKPGDSEKTYRVTIQELPPLVPGADGTQQAVKMLAKMSIPIFVQGPSPKAIPTVAAIAMRGSELRFDVKNTGTAHYRAEKLIARAKAAGGKVVHEKELDTWYVLAGGTRTYVVNLPPEACAAFNSVEIDLQTDSGGAKASLANAKCSP